MKVQFRSAYRWNYYSFSGCRLFGALIPKGCSVCLPLNVIRNQCFLLWKPRFNWIGKRTRNTVSSVCSHRTQSRLWHMQTVDLLFKTRNRIGSARKCRSPHKNIWFFRDFVHLLCHSHRASCHMIWVSYSLSHRGFEIVEVPDVVLVFRLHILHRWEHMHSACEGWPEFETTGDSMGVWTITTSRMGNRVC